MEKYFIASSVRVMRYLYALGFEKESFINDNNRENWKFKYTNALQKALDFYFYMRNQTLGVNENGKNCRKDT